MAKLTEKNLQEFVSSYAVVEKKKTEAKASVCTLRQLNEQIPVSWFKIKKEKAEDNVLSFNQKSK